MKLRAQRLEETRLRITEALVDLHRTVGPARTTVAEVARKAGVRRMTVYNHFPTDLEMIDACSSHWAAGHPLPEPGEWSRIVDPDDRTRRLLEGLYRYYRDNQDMIGNFVRDAPLVPALAEILKARWFPALASLAEVLVDGRRAGAPGEVALRATVDLTLAFETWKLLADRGLGDAAAAEVGAMMIRGLSAS